MKDRSPNDAALPLPLARQVDAVCGRFEDAWLAGRRPQIEQYLGELTEPGRAALLRELLILEMEYRLRRGDRPERKEYQARFPEHSELISQVHRNVLASTSAARRPEIGDISEPVTDRAHEAAATETSAVEPEAGEAKKEAAAGLPDDPAGFPRGDPTQALPATIGRYRVERLLGSGGFGNVYLAHDDELDRLVAIKVPHGHRAWSPEDAQRHLAEGRAVASLDHPSIVPVYDVGRTDEGSYYVVSKFIEGSDLAKKIEQDRPSCRESAELVATVADALHHAHLRGLVHRDIKPGNVLIDSAGHAYVVDFGLALREEDFGREASYGGTLAYMSPEQARGEGHLVDGRADIFSLGVVLYELLTGRRPFRGESRAELLEQIAAVEARPLRQVDDTIPIELETICLKALSKRASDRYPTGLDLASDLRGYLADSAPADGAPSPAATGGWSPRMMVAVSAFAVIGVCLVGLLTWGILDAAFRRPEISTPPGPSAQPKVTKEPGGQTEPKVAIEGGAVFVRRDRDDNAIDKFPLQQEPSEKPVAFPPLGPNDDFKIDAKLSRPAYWCLVWIDTNGLVELVASSDKPEEVAEYPAGPELVGVNPTDPAGFHLLALLVSDRPPAAVEEALLSRLADIGPPPKARPGDYVQLRGTRGPGAVSPTEANLDAGYCRRLESRLPEGVHWALQLWLPTKR